MPYLEASEYQALVLDRTRLENEVAELREALKWALCHAEQGEDEPNFYAGYDRAYALISPPAQDSSQA